MKRLLALCLLGSCLALSGRAALLDEMKAQMNEVLTLLQAHPEGVPVADLKDVLGKQFSFYTISRRALGLGWNQFSPEQQTQFVDRFTDLLVNSYASRYSSTRDVAVNWGAVTDLGGNKQEVTSAVVVDGESFEVRYRLAKIQDRWQIYDVLIESVSMVSNYRQQFDALLAKGGPQAVLDSLANKQDD